MLTQEAIRIIALFVASSVPLLQISRYQIAHKHSHAGRKDHFAILKKIQCVCVCVWEREQARELCSWRKCAHRLSPLCKCFQSREYISGEPSEQERKKETSRPLIKLILLRRAARTFCTACTRPSLSLSRRCSKAINRMEKIIDLLCNLLCCWMASAAATLAKRGTADILANLFNTCERVCISK